MAVRWLVLEALAGGGVRWWRAVEVLAALGILEVLAGRGGGIKCFAYGVDFDRLMMWYERKAR